MTEEVINDSYLKCPYCEYENPNSFELEDENEKHECENCQEIFSYVSDVTRTFTSEKLNKE
jgi:DNA-directed RNA polymerase subunit RPC12/RpoP